jgi:hypothetical protein
MHPAISYDLVQAHIADLRHRARLDRLARAARRARRNPPRHLTRRPGPPSAGRLMRILPTQATASGPPDSQFTIRGR